MQLQALRRDCANKAMRVKKLWLLSGEDVKRLGSVGLKLAGMQLALTFTFVVSFIPYVCIGSFRRLFIMQRSAPPHPQVLKESLSSLHPAPPKEEALTSSSSAEGKPELSPPSSPQGRGSQAAVALTSASRHCTAQRVLSCL